MKSIFQNAVMGSIFSFSLLFAGGNAMLVQKGTAAPDFSLVSSDSDTVRLSGFKGKNNVVLIFYPGDETPGCTKQLCAVRDDYSLFEAANVKVFGVNPGTLASHRKFVKNHTFPFPLLFDENRKVAALYGCDGLLKIQRTVVVIGLDGDVLYVKQGMPSNREILASTLKDPD